MDCIRQNLANLLFKSPFIKLMLALTCTFILQACVSGGVSTETTNIELEGAATEEIEDSSFVKLTSTNTYRFGEQFLTLDEDAFPDNNYKITINIDPRGRIVRNPKIVLPNGFETIGNPNFFSTMEGSCTDIITTPCTLVIQYLPRNNYQNGAEIIFQYSHLGKGYLNRLKLDLRSTSKLNTGLARGAISNGVGSNMCGIGEGGQVKCWGKLSHQTLGVDTQFSIWGDSIAEMGNRLPVLTMEAKITKIKIRNKIGCVLFDDNEFKCFGKNNDGGTGSDNSLAYTPREVAQLPPLDFGPGKIVKDFSIGEGFVCAIVEDPGLNQEVFCWGRNDYGQNGTGDTLAFGFGLITYSNSLGYYKNLFTEFLLPVDLKHQARITKIVSGIGSTCILYDDGEVKCWGDNLYGQLGLGDSSNRGDSPGEIHNPLDANPNFLIDLGTAKSASNIFGGNSDHFCAQLSLTELKCWGRNDKGQLGQGDVSHRGDTALEMGDNLLRIDFDASLEIVDVAIGRDSTCVLFNDTNLTGEAAINLRCFGKGSRIGQGSTLNIGDQAGEINALAAISFGSDFQIEKILGSDHSTCVQGTDKEIKCFGENEHGQLGLGHTNTMGDSFLEMGSALPKISLPNHTDLDHFIVDQYISCAVLDDRNLSCFGSNQYGFIESTKGMDIGTDPSNSGAGMPGLALDSQQKAIQVSVGTNHACALFENRRIKCWGKNNYGQLGLGHNRDIINIEDEISEIPYVDLGSFVEVESIHAGQDHTCAVVYLPFVYDNSDLAPLPHRVKCWGRTEDGQTGLETSNHVGDRTSEMGDSLPYVDLGSDADGNPYLVIDLDTGLNHNCAIVNTDVDNIAGTREIKCWGQNNYGQLGQQSSFNVGNDIGEMGNNLQSSSVSVGGVDYTDFAEIKLGYNHSCVRRSTSIYCWGKNDKGQLGVGHTNTIGDNGGEMGNNLVAVQLSSSSSTVSNLIDFNYSLGIPYIDRRNKWSVGGDFACVINYSSSSRVHCWGDGKYSGIGSGINIGNSPGSFSGSTNQFTGSVVKGISSQGKSTCLSYADGRAVCWGDGSYLGNGRSHDLGQYYYNLNIPVFPYLWF